MPHSSIPAVEKSEISQTNGRTIGQPIDRRPGRPSTEIADLLDIGPGKGKSPRTCVVRFLIVSPTQDTDSIRYGHFVDLVGEFQALVGSPSPATISIFHLTPDICQPRPRPIGVALGVLFAGHAPLARNTQLHCSARSDAGRAGLHARLGTPAHDRGLNQRARIAADRWPARPASKPPRPPRVGRAHSRRCHCPSRPSSRSENARTACGSRPASPKAARTSFGTRPSRSCATRTSRTRCGRRIRCDRQVLPVLPGSRMGLRKPSAPGLERKARRLPLR